MKPLKIGKLIFSKKAIQTICFGAFFFGIILGAFIMHSIKTENSFSIGLFSLFATPIFILLKPILKKEITKIN